ncbi:sigma-54 dependent transcriptional regulator [bacterium]|nr:sigma-54 dependent transcriptional regulator [bacterium]
MKTSGDMTETPIQVLVADDDAHIRTLLNYTLERQGFRTLTARNGREALDQATEDLDVALLDVSMPVLDGLQCLAEMTRIHPDIQTIMITAHSDIRAAARASKNGAFDYVAKPFNPEELVSTVRQAARFGRLRRENRRLHLENRRLRQAIVSPEPPLVYIGTSDVSRRVLENALRLAPLDGNLLLTGECGVGKSLLARLIHQASTRAAGQFITVNCTTLPRELVESELFGHERGSFTADSERRLGRVEMAEGGTLFLDEVGDIPLDLQPRLLTFLQNGRFQRVGGDHDVHVDVRLIASTNRDLQAMVRERMFREDLFLQLNVRSLAIPPLREHPSDIPALVEHYLDRAGRRNNQPTKCLTQEALDKLQHYHWPGNMRELENVLEQASAFCDEAQIGAERIPLRHAAEEIRTTSARPLAGLTLEELERIAIDQTLETCRGNKARSARMLGISEKTIYNKLLKFSSKPKPDAQARNANLSL